MLLPLLSRTKGGGVTAAVEVEHVTRLEGDLTGGGPLLGCRCKVYVEVGIEAIQATAER